MVMDEMKRNELVCSGLMVFVTALQYYLKSCVGGRYNPCIDLLVPMQLTVNQPSILFSILVIGNMIRIRPSLLDGKDVDDVM